MIRVIFVRLLCRTLLTFTTLGLVHGHVHAQATAPASAIFQTCAQPVYPKASLRNEEQGTVTLGFLIETDGRVSDSKIVKSSGFPLLDIAAKVALARCSFKPATKDGKEVSAWAQVQYVWTLEGPAPVPEERLRAMRTAAEGGDSHAEVELALHYINAEGANKNLGEAHRLLTSAAAKNHAEAQYALATMQQSVSIARAPMTETATLYRRAAEQGHPGAQHMLGLMLMYGKGVSKDAREAMVWFRKASAQGHAGSDGRLGAMLTTSGSSPDDMAEGIRLLRRGAEATDAYAQFALGQCYEHSRGVRPDKAQALALYNLAAEAGNMSARSALRELTAQTKPSAGDAIR
jgi:uncharacterized protein